MTEEQLHKLQPELKALAGKSPENKRQRRRLIKGAAAFPIIITLHSGAALARTSNLIGDPASVSTPQILEDLGGNDKLVCVYPDPLDLEAPPLVDLGLTPEGKLGALDKGCADVANGVVISSGAYASINIRSGISIDKM